MASEIRPGNASKAAAAWICALLIVFVQLSGVNCGETAAERQRTLELGIPSSDPTYAGPMPLGHEIASSSHASSRRGGGRRELMGGELAGVIVGAIGTLGLIAFLIWMVKRDLEQARAEMRRAPVVTATLGFESLPASPVKSPPAPSRAPAPPAQGTATPRTQAPKTPLPGTATPRPTSLATPRPQPPIPPAVPPPAFYPPPVGQSGISSLMHSVQLPTSVQLPASISMTPRVTYDSAAPQQPFIPAIPVGSAAGHVVPNTTVFL